MAQQASLTQQTGNLSLFKLLWRADAALTLIASAFIIFATSTVIDMMGMSDGADVILRIEGSILSLYALWQLWVARDGSIAPRNFQIARALMAITGVDFVAAPLLLDFNTFGAVVTVLIGASIWGLALAWHLALRENH